MAMSTQEFYERLGQVLEIIQQSPEFSKKVAAARADSKKDPKSLNDFRSTFDSQKDLTMPKQEQQQTLKELARARRALRISSNAFLSIGTAIPPEMRQRMDNLDARINELRN